MSELAWFEDAGTFVVYSGLSGCTHRLEPEASLVFAASMDRPVSAPELRRRLAARWDVPEEEIDEAALARTITGLEEAGLLVPAEA